MNRKKTLIISTLILLAGIAITSFIFMTEPKAVRSGATKETAMLVEVAKVKRGTFHPTITAMGTVEPSQDIVLAPRVGGEIINMSDSFIPGGFVKKGEPLLNIDPADYENTLQQRKSHLEQMLADLNIEMGRQNVAQKDYQLLEETLSKEQEALILRQPQLNAVKSKVEAARAAVTQAELELKRTTIKAPFDAHILHRNVNVGSQVTPGRNLARLVGIDSYWVVTTVSPANLRWLKFPGNNKETGSEVTIRNKSAWPKGAYRTGNLHRLVGSLEEKTRMARVIITVPDPLARRKESKGRPTLMIGSFVETKIQARQITGVVRVHRDYIRKNSTVWIMENRKLRIRSVEILFRDKTYAYISKGLDNHNMIVTTNLSTVVDGAGLRLKSDIPTGTEPGPNTEETTQTDTTGGSGK